MDKFLFNEDIPHKEVRLKTNGKSVGIFSLDEVLDMAEKDSCDVVMITDKSTPPVVEFCEKTRFLYEKKKRETQQKKKQHQMELQEIKLGVLIDQHDINHKIQNIKKIIEKGNQVKLSIRLRYRQLNKKEQAIEVVKKTIDLLQNICKPEKDIIVDNNLIYCICVPLKNKS